jgi:hypothetical protein
MMLILPAKPQSRGQGVNQTGGSALPNADHAPVTALNTFATLGNAVLDLVTTIGRDHWPPDSPAGFEWADDQTYADGYPTTDPKPVTDAQLGAVT